MDNERNVWKQPEVDKVATAFSIEMSRNPNSVVWQDGEAIEYEIFEKAGYIHGSKDIQVEYDKYEPVSDIAVIYDKGVPVGVVRMINYDPEIGFKTVNDIKMGRLVITPEGQELLDSLDPRLMCEGATAGLKPEYRSKPGDEIHPVTQLYGIGYTYSLENGTPYVIASYDEKFLGRYEQLFGAALTRLGPPTDYMGSPTVPVIIDMQALRDYFIEAGLEEFETALTAIGAGVMRDD